MINKVILMGRLTADPELKQTQGGIAMCRFTVAVNRQFKAKDSNERQADFINVVTWRQTAEFVSKYFSKGKMIIVEGQIRNNNYTDNNGIKHYGYDVFAENVTFGESMSAGNGGNAQPNGNFGQPNNGGGFNNNADRNYQNHNSFQNTPSFSPNPQNNQSAPPSNDFEFNGFEGFEEILGEGDVPF